MRNSLRREKGNRTNNFMPAQINLYAKREIELKKKKEMARGLWQKSIRKMKIASENQ